jgi:hypothetical protein
LSTCLKNYNIKNETKYGFILAKKYTFNIDKKRCMLENPFENLGIINYDSILINGKDIDECIQNAKRWYKELENWKTMKVYPPSHKELRVNMKNSYDHGYLHEKSYKKIKTEIALLNRDITLLPHCNINHRDNAIKHNIYCYDDKRLTTKILGFKENSNASILLNNMLKFINSKNEFRLLRSNNVNKWQKKVKYEFYVDFETYHPDKLIDKTDDEILINLDSVQLYMIGVNIVIDDVHHYKCFIIDFKDNCIKDENYIFCKSEEDLLYKFIDYIFSIKSARISIKNFIDNLRLIHWSYIEKILFKQKLETYKIPNKFINNWFDLLQIFKNPKNPILIKDCFNFKLKSVCNKLNEKKIINIIWDDLDDGLLSSFIAKNIYLSASIKIPSDNMNKIIKYNSIDCKALYELLNFIRTQK